MRVILLLIALYSTGLLCAQVDTLTDLIISDFIEGQESEEGEHFNEDEWSEYAWLVENPYNINEVTREDLIQLRFLTELQVMSLIEYRNSLGPIIDLHELQAVPHWDLQTIKTVLPFFSTKSTGKYHVALIKMLQKGENDLYLRMERTLEESSGYKVKEGDSIPKYPGDRNRYYMHYVHRHENRMYYGFTLEKDAGELLGLKEGVDFSSFHFFLKDYSRMLSTLAIGDYTLRLGQGLCMHMGYGSRKSAFVTSVTRGGRPIHKYASSGEYRFLRGAAATVVLSEKIDITGFVSRRMIDGNELNSSDIENEEEVVLTSFLQSGLHRTESERADRKNTEHLIGGGSIKLNQGRLRLAANAVHHRFDSPFIPGLRPSDLYDFSGQHLTNASIDYAYTLKNFHFFGEEALAMQENQKTAAFLNGVVAGLDRTVSFSLLHRYFPAEYYAIFSDPFSEVTGGKNEHGLYAGIEFIPVWNWKLAAYADIWSHPWLRHNADKPSNGSEQFVRLTYREKRRIDLYAQYKHERKQKNSYTSEFLLQDYHRSSTRLHFAFKLSKALEVRTRLEKSWFTDEDGTSEGVLLYQDVIFKPIGFSLSCTSRFAIFDTDDYDSRIYSYENDVLRSFSIPPYYYKGLRYYLNLRYKTWSGFTFEFRIARTHYNNRETIGSGNDKIDSSHRTQIKAQVKYKF